MFPVEIELLFSDPEWFLSHFAFYCPIQDIVRNGSSIIREFVCGDDFLDLWERWFVVGPAVETLQRNISAERIILHSHGLIISERRNGGGKEFSPFSRFHHMFYDSRNKRFVLFFGVLFVEDTVLFVVKTDASEKIGRIEAFHGTNNVV